jgi:2'-5' RNA ligase
MRLFVAVIPPEREVAALDAAIGERDRSLRWVPPRQWHVTLVFCGEVRQSIVEELTSRLERAAARTTPLSLRLDGAGTFPAQPRRARALWVGLDGDVVTLTRLAERCAAAARRCGIAVEERKFRPHLTLGRARRGTVDVTEHVHGLSSYAGSPWQVSSIRLVHSTLGATVRHEPLADLPIGGAGHQA